jgi:hypothetical protein
LQTAFVQRERKCAELSCEVKQQWQVEAVYTLPVIISATGVIPHTLRDVLKRRDLLDPLYVTIQRYDTCDRKFLGEAHFSNSLFVLIFNFIITHEVIQFCRVQRELVMQKQKQQQQ